MLENRYKICQDLLCYISQLLTWYEWVARGPASRARDHSWSALETGPRAPHSYQVKNLFIIPLCYVTILSTSSTLKCVNVFKKHIYMFYWLWKSYYWSDHLHLSCRNQSVKSLVGRRFLVCWLCVYECHDVTAHDVMTTKSKMSVTAHDVMTTTSKIRAKKSGH